VTRPLSILSLLIVGVLASGAAPPNSGEGAPALWGSHTTTDGQPSPPDAEFCRPPGPYTPTPDKPYLPQITGCSQQSSVAPGKAVSDFTCSLGGGGDFRMRKTDEVIAPDHERISIETDGGGPAHIHRVHTMDFTRIGPCPEGMHAGQVRFPDGVVVEAADTRAMMAEMKKFTSHPAP